MMARRLVLSLVLLTLVGNASVFAGPNASGKTQAFDLVSLKLETVGPLTRILIETSAPPLYTIFRPTDRLIVVDLPGAEASRLASQYSVKSALVESIMVHQSHAGRAVARIEVGVQAGARDRSSVKGNTLVIEISPDGKAAPSDLTRGLTRGLTAKVTKDADTSAEVKKDVRPASLKPADPRTALPGVTVYSAPLASKSSPAATEPALEKVTPKPSDLKPATLIRAVRSEAADGAVRIVVDTDGVAQYKDFVLPDPWRIVIDVTGVRSAFGNKTTVVGAALVDRFRVGQPSPNVVRIVLDTKSKVSYHVVREGQSLVITVGNGGTSYRENTRPQADAKAQNTTAGTNNAVKEAAAPQHKPEVKVAGDRIENKSADNKTDQKDAIVPSNLLAQANTQSSGQKVSSQPNRSLPLPTQPAPQPSSAKPLSTQSSQPSVTRSVLDVQRPSQVNPGSQAQKRAEVAFCDPAFVGGLISFDLRAGVDIRDMLRFISQQYGVNFIVDKSVSQVPVDIRVTDRPWNLVMDSVMRANRLGAVCDNTGIIRIATLAAVKEEEEQTRAIAEEKAKQVPLVTKIIHLKYARAAGQLGNSGGGASGRGGGGGGGGMSSGGGGGATGQGSLIAIVNSRLSPRGRTEIDARTNSLIVTDLPEYTQVIEDMISKLDRAEPQVEIETRIVIASRNFLRDIGSELAGANIGTNGRGGMAQTSGQQFTGGSLQQGSASGGGSGSSSSTGSGSGTGSGSASATTKGLGPNLIGPFADNSLRAVANSVLSLTTGPIGTGILSMALSASETKGQIRTIASPRVTTTDNKTAEIVNGVQIPVQTVSNNTITTTFVTAALRLEITPQIIEENGQVLMHVVAENNSVDFGLANQFNNGTPGIDTQSAETTVLVADGGTTVMGGINIDSEGHTVNRTPGISRIPLLGELFKHRSTRRDSNEILFFVTPRIIRNDGTMGPRLPQRSSVEGMPNPNVQQGVAPAAKDSKTDPKAAQVAPATTAVVPGKGGQ